MICRLLELDSLARIACTCKSITESALDTLWREQKTLGPLVMVMPGDLWEQADFGLLKLTRPLRESDWPRFEFYARRIQHLGIEEDHINWSSYPDTYLDVNVFSAFGSYRPTRTLLPNLRAFTLDGGEEQAAAECLPHLQILLGPSVRVINITSVYSLDESTLPEFLSDIFRVCPQVEDVRLEDCEDLQHMKQMIMDLHGLRNIHVEMMTLTSDLIRHLGALPALERLGIVVIPPDILQSKKAPSLFPNQFQALRDLSFIVSDWFQAGIFLEFLQVPLTKLCVRMSAVDSQSTPITAIVPTLCLTATTLVSLSLRQNASRHVDGTPADVLFAFRTLFSLRALHSITLRLPCVVHLDDSWIKDASLSWPALQSISISFGEEYQFLVHQQKPAITLQGLIPLVANCPRLSKISIPLQGIPFHPAMPMKSHAFNSRITSITLWPATIQQPKQVFRSLVAIFPSLRQIRVSGIDQQGISDWRVVRDLLRESAFKV
ncbi:hypothetical protein H0H93_016469 [Arthromyces matolae]|nr:hypothetical protein H0H93_016469 [Arthromyces matolae]